MKNVLILNTHSILNPGDTAIVLSQIHLLSKHLPGARITITSRTPKIDAHFYGPLGVRVLPPLLPAPSVYLGWTEKLTGCLRDAFGFGKKFALIQAIKRSDLVCASGGGYLYSNRRHFPGPMFLQALLHLRLALWFDKPLLFLPQSFGPFYNRTARRMIRRLLDHPRVIRIFARETKSIDLLHGLMEKNLSRLEVCPDTVFSLKSFMNITAQNTAPPPVRPRVGITVRRWDFPDTRSRREKQRKRRDYLQQLADACGTIHQRLGGSFLLVPQVRGPGRFEDDEETTREFFILLKSRVPATHIDSLDLNNSTHPLDILRHVSSLDLMIATRFHSALFALLAGVPAITIAYQHKGQGIMSMLGLDPFCVPMERLSGARVSSLAEQVIAGRDTTVSQVAGRLSQLGDDVDRIIGATLRSIASSEKR